MKLLFYNDSKQLGGHEALMVHAVSYLSSAGYSVDVIISAHNRQLKERLQKESKSNVTEINYSSNRIQLVRNFFSVRTIFKIRNILKKIQPDLFISVQGTIELSSMGMFAGKITGQKTVVYIPLAQYLKEVSNNRIKGKIKEVFLFSFWRMPDAYITINSTMQKLINTRTSKPVLIARNGIDISKYCFYDKALCRKKLDLPMNKFIVGLIGRIEYWHKGCDLFLKFIKEKKEKPVFSNIFFIVVGDGADRKSLESELEKMDNVRLLAWSENISEIYSSIDCLFLPSRFESGEGAPLTLLEAMFFKIPVVASKIDGIDKILPDSWLFGVGDMDGMEKALAEVVFNDNSCILNNNKNLIDKQFTITNFNKEFEQSIVECKSLLKPK